MPTTASRIEIVWTVSALIGLAINVWAMLDAIYDLHALRAEGLNGAREIVAKGNIRREWGRIFVQLCFTTIGAVAMIEPADHARRQPSPLAITFTLALVLAAASLVVDAFLDRLERHRLIDYINEHDQESGY